MIWHLVSCLFKQTPSFHESTFLRLFNRFNQFDDLLIKLRCIAHLFEVLSPSVGIIHRKGTVSDQFYSLPSFFFHDKDALDAPLHNICVDLHEKVTNKKGKGSRK